MADIEREWGWVDFLERPVLIATRIVGGDDNRALFIALDEAARSAGGETIAEGAGTIVIPASSAAARWISSVAA